MRSRGIAIKLSYNLSHANMDCSYLFEACTKYRITDVRFSFVNPNHNATNEFIDYDQLPETGKRVVDFVRQGRKRGLSMEMDCTVPFCIFTEDERFFMERMCRQFMGVCPHAIDVNPDLSAYRCLSTSFFKVPSVTNFRRFDELVNHLNEKTQNLRWQVLAYAQCKTCKYWRRKQCQGGCLGLKHMRQGAKLKKLTEPETQNKIGIRVVGGIGDGMLATPTIRAIKKNSPETEIYCVCNTNNEPVLRNNPNIDCLSVIPDESAFRDINSFERVIETNYSRFKPSLHGTHAVDMIARLAGIKLDEGEKQIQFFLSEEDEAFARDTLKSHKNPVILHITSKSTGNQDWFLDRWERVVREVKKAEDCTFIQVGLEGEKRVRGAINLLGKTTVAQAVALVKHAKIFVGVDSFLNHATNATGTPGVVLFGASNPAVWGHDRNINLFTSADCSPCIDTEKGLKPCFHKKCMRTITVSSVTGAIHKQFRKTDGKK